MSSGSGLPPLEHAVFAVTSRLIACLVTEQTLPAFYIPAAGISTNVSGLLVVTFTEPEVRTPHEPSFDLERVFALVPLCHPPVLAQKYAVICSVGLVDPLDMYPAVFELSGSESVSTARQLAEGDINRKIASWLASYFGDSAPPATVLSVTDPVVLWNKFTRNTSHEINAALRVAIEREIKSSFDYQLLAYQNPPKCPSLSSSPIDWEQSIVAGHPTHPMHRARVLVAPADSDTFDYDWYRPQLRFVRVSRSELNMSGPFEDLVRQLVETAAQRAGKKLSDDPSSVYLPAHEIQLANIRRKFPGVEVLHPDISLPCRAQASLRTVVVAEHPQIALKLALGVRISSGLRTISRFTANFVPRWTAEIIPKLTFDRDILFICPESASGVLKSMDQDVAEHSTAVIREEYQPQQGEAVIVCAALLEMDHAGVPPGISAVEHIFKLDTLEKRAAFLDRYLQVACRAFLPPLIYNGVRFELHAQNILARFNIATGQLLGFVIRDMGGLRVHPGTLRRSIGTNFEFLPGHVAVSETLEEIYPGFYHGLVNNHLQRLIRLLGMHYNGRGWEMLLRHMKAQIPADHALWKLWLSRDSKTVLSKYLLRMRMSDMYRQTLYGPVPNLIQYRGEDKYLSSNGTRGHLHSKL